MDSRASTLARLRASHGRLTSLALTKIDNNLDWYRELPPPVRSQLGLVVQGAISAFTAWYADPHTPVRGAHEVFAGAPPELARSISLQRTLQLVRLIVSVVEDQADQIASPGAVRDFRESVLLYSREVAFSAAEVYARSAEMRGAWDARLEAFAVDALIRGEIDTAFYSRIGALGWKAHGPVVAVVGAATPAMDDVRIGTLRRAVRRTARDSLVGIHTDAVVVVLAGPGDLHEDITSLFEHFGPGPIVYTSAFPTLADAVPGVQGAICGLRACAAWPGSPRPVHADDVLPERVLAGDDAARVTLVRRCLGPLVDAGGPLLQTLASYLEDGLSLEAAARKLYVHPNTVRYRMRRIAEITGLDPLTPRAAFVLHTALVVSRLDAVAPDLWESTKIGVMVFIGV